MSTKGRIRLFEMKVQNEQTLQGLNNIKHAVESLFRPFERLTRPLGKIARSDLFQRMNELRYSSLPDIEQPSHLADLPKAADFMGTGKYSTTQAPKKKRKKHGAVSVKEAANAAGVSAITIEKWENGTREKDSRYPGRENAISFFAWAHTYKLGKAARREARNKDRAIPMSGKALGDAEDSAAMYGK